MDLPTDAAWVPTKFLCSRAQRYLANAPSLPWEPKMLLPEVDSAHPAIMSTDPAFLDFQREVRQRLIDECPPSEAVDGLYDSRAVPMAWDSASYVAGFAMNPVTVPPLDNTGLRSDLGLCSRFLRPEDERIYEELFRLMMHPDNRVKTTAHFNRLASSGAPFRFTNSGMRKLQILESITGIPCSPNSLQPLQPNRLHLVGELLLREKFDEAADKYGFSQLDLIGFRKQNDKGKYDATKRIFTPKERLVNDLEYALTGGRRGRRFPAHREVIINGKVIPDMAAQRARTVHGGPGCMNYPLTCLLAMVRKHYFERYAFTFHHRGAHDIRAKLQAFEGFLSLDIAQYDQSVPRFLIDKWLEMWSQCLPETACAVFGMRFDMPFFLPNPDVNGRGGVVVGDPSKKNKFAYGLPSGIADNPDFGKFHVTWALMCIFDRMYHDVHTAEQIDLFLRGRHPHIGLLNCGDDTVIGIRGGEVREDVAADIASIAKGGYFDIKPEDAGAFLGNVIYRRSDGTLDVAPNIFSYYANWWMPERGVDHPSRREYWAVGFNARRALFAAAPMFEVVDRAIEDAFKHHFRSSPRDYAIINDHTFSRESDLMVMLNPDYLHYRVEPDEVSSEVLQRISATVDEDTTARIVDAMLHV